MQITTKLPFDCCENCSEFVLKVDDNFIHLSNGYNCREITVRCKNAGKCKHPRKKLTKKGD